jgi:hypothetical protein
MTRISTDRRPPLLIPWGPGDSLPLELPKSWEVVDVPWPDLSGPLTDYNAALVRALDDPGVEPLLGAIARPGASVAIIVDDPTRWTPVREALPTVLAKLRGRGSADLSLSVTAGVGRHHAVDEAAMRLRVGDAVVDSYPWFSPPVDDLSEYDDLGTTAEGIPVRVFRPVVRADLRVLIGSVLPHLQAGFGGGYKLIFPGTSHRSTLGALHAKGLAGDHAGTLLGSDATENPMRLAIRSAAAKLGPCLSISHLLGPPGTILEVAAGHPDAVQDRLVGEARRRFQAPRIDPSTVDLVIAGNDPWPGDPMMSFKVLLQHRAACRPGGVLAGFFWTDPAAIDRSVPMPALRGIAATGRFGGWALRRGLLAADRIASAMHSPSEFLIRWARELVVDRTVLVYAPPLRAAIGPNLGPIRLFDDQALLYRAAEAALPATVHPRCRVFPQGGLTYCPAS